MGSNPTPSAGERSPPPDRAVFEPRVEAAALRVLASPSGRLAPDLGRESHPLRWQGGFRTQGGGSRRFRVLGPSSARWAGCESIPCRHSGRCARLPIEPRVEAAGYAITAPLGWLARASVVNPSFPVGGRACGTPLAAGEGGPRGNWRIFPCRRSRTRFDEFWPWMFGRVAEWLKAHDWKSCGLTPTWVRIPPRPLASGARPRTGRSSNPGLRLRRFASSPRLRAGWRRTSAANPTPSAGGGAPRRVAVEPQPPSAGGIAVAERRERPPIGFIAASGRQPHFGAWLSPVERCVRVAEVPGSNPGAPILTAGGGYPSPSRSARFRPEA